MLFAIHYTTRYDYDAPVTDNLNALRVRPATTTTQRCDEFHVRIDPETRLGRHADYFGTEVIEFGISQAHSSLAIDVRARVVTADPLEPPQPAWDALDTPAYLEAAGEYLLDSIPAPAGDAIDELVQASAAEDPLATADAVCSLIPDRFEYSRGVTYVGSTVEDLLEAGAGVCQDFVHLALILLRRQGVAARYVSGYLFAAPPDPPLEGAGGGADSVEVDTHAWLELLLPDGGERGEPGVRAGRPRRLRAAPRHAAPRHPCARHARRDPADPAELPRRPGIAAVGDRRARQRHRRSRRAPGGLLPG